MAENDDIFDLTQDDPPPIEILNESEQRGRCVYRVREDLFEKCLTNAIIETINGISAIKTTPAVCSATQCTVVSSSGPENTASKETRRESVETSAPSTSALSTSPGTNGHATDCPAYRSTMAPQASSSVNTNTASKRMRAGSVKTSALSTSPGTNGHATDCPAYRSTMAPQAFRSVNTNTANKRMKTESVGNMEDKLAKKAATAAKKIELAEEKAAKLAAMEANKIYKPGVCMQYMYIEMDPALLSEWYMEGVAAEAAAAGCHLRPAPGDRDEALVMWARREPPELNAAGGELSLPPVYSACGVALYVLEAYLAAGQVAERSLGARMRHARGVGACRLTLVVYGAKDFFKSQRKSANSNRKLVTPTDLEMAITDLLVSTGCDVLLVDTPADMAQLVVNYTRAAARAPLELAKRAVDEQAGYYMRGDNKNTVGLDGAGGGGARLWQQMVSALPHASLEAARALCREFQTPLLLHEALAAPGGEARVASLGVPRAAGGRARRLGPELARRLHRLLTEEDGHRPLD